jgi:DNA processing protein
MTAERAAWIAMSAVPGLGPARFRRLLEVFGSPLLALDAGPEALCQQLDLPESASEQLEQVAASLEQAQEGLLSLSEQGIMVYTWQDADYPSRLLSTSSPPPVLWWRSDRWSTEPETAVAVVGSREVFDRGLAEACSISQSLADKGITVVSGLAAGIDAAAHEAALDCGGPTFGVLGCGLVTALARGGDGLAGRVAEKGGLCSQFAPAAPLSPKLLFARDKTIAGLSDAVIVVEARAEGGAVHTAKCALDENRPVLAVDWPEDELGGSRQLLALGAKPLAPGEDVVRIVTDLLSD